MHIEAIVGRTTGSDDGDYEYHYDNNEYDSLFLPHIKEREGSALSPVIMDILFNIREEQLELFIRNRIKCKILQDLSHSLKREEKGLKAILKAKHKQNPCIYKYTPKLKYKLTNFKCNGH